MKYLVDKKTKEHRPYYGGSIEWAEDQGLDIVRADSEGWIAHTGDVCPLPDDVLCDTKWENWQGGPRMAAGHWKWRDPSITHYRPILAEKAQEPEPVVKESFTTGLLDRLKAAHAQAQTIPDLEAELREVLGSMGYDLVTRSPFFETEAHGTDAAVKDALIYGTSVMRGGKYTPIQDFYVAPEAAKENNDEL